MVDTMNASDLGYRDNPASSSPTSSMPAAPARDPAAAHMRQACDCASGHKRPEVLFGEGPAAATPRNPAQREPRATRTPRNENPAQREPRAIPRNENPAQRETPREPRARSNRSPFQPAPRQRRPCRGMYIWRGKNSRDKRNLLLLGEQGWTAATDDRSHAVEDEVLRCEREKQHVQYFLKRVRELMAEYLKTSDGKNEIDLLRREIERIRRTTNAVADESDALKRNVLEIFSEFTVEKNSDLIDREGLMGLMSHLGMTVSEKQFKQYLRRLRFTVDKHTIPFETFYEGFLDELQRKKSLLDSVLSLGRKEKPMTELEKIQHEEAQEMQGVNMSWFIRLQLRNSEARRTLMDHAVFHAEQDAIEEFRKAHPPTQICTECGTTLPDNRSLQLHRRDKALHREILRKKVADEERFAAVEAIFSGDQGRHLRALRLVFNSELGGQRIRVEVARKDPFRPQLMDGGKSYDRMLKGAMVQGFDPSRGIRPTFRKDGLIRQHLAPLRRAPDADSFAQTVFPELRSVIRDLVRCQDDFIDIVSCRDHPNHVMLSIENGENLLAFVRFEWNSHAIRTVCLVGEFTGWRPVEMLCDIATGRFFHTRELPPGRYKYRFMVDGVPSVDAVASQVEDAGSPCGRSNILLVTPDPIFRSEGEEGALPPVHAQPSLTQSSLSSFTHPGAITHVSLMDKSTLTSRLEHINLRNLALYDDGVWALATYVQKNNIIKTVDLSYNDISDEGVQALALCIDRLTALEALRLNGNGFGVDACRYITEHAKKSRFLTVLELSNNRLGDDGIEVLCRFLRYNEVLLDLYVDACYVGDDGMECLHEAMLLNRKLQLLSLSGNRITQAGAEQLCGMLKENAALLSLNLSNNALGAEGVKAIGNALYTNDTLEHVGLDRVDLLSARSSAGLHSLCYALQRNRHLLSLSLAYNGMTDRHVAELGHALMANRSVETVELQGNNFDKNWLVVTKTLDTHIMADMPSVAASLEKNRQLKQLENYDDDLKSHVQDDVRFGRWTKRRVWKRVELDAEEKQRRKAAVSAEYARMLSEDLHLRGKVREAMNVYRLYLDEQPCKQYLQMCATAIVQYFHDLPLFDSAQHELPQLADSQTQLPGRRMSSVHLRQEGIMIEKSRKHGAGPVAARAESSGSSSRLSLLPLFRSLSLGGLSRWSSAKNFNPTFFLHSHVAVLTAVFMTMEGGLPSMLLQPERLEHAMTILTLPLPTSEVQAAVDQTLVRSARKIGMHKMSDYVLRHAAALASANALQRTRTLADLVFRPPLLEAKAIVLHSLRRTVLSELREAYRVDPVHRPLFLCDYCRKRFATQKLLDKHVSKGLNNEYHRRYAMEEIIHRSQRVFLQQIKRQFTGVFFPAYFELLPTDQLPYEYYPQVVDKMGQGGRPIGVIEAFRTVKVLDVLGDFLHVVLRDQLGWVRYKKGKQVFLRPISGFDWENLRIQDSVCYYRVNDNLPPEIELKIRHRPALDAEVLGYLKTNQVIAVLGKMDNWLQVSFEGEDAGWILVRPDVRPAAPPPEVSSSAAPGSPVSVGKRVGSPVRKRRMDLRSTPVEVVEEDEDTIFNDQIVTYEINGKRFRNNTKHHPEISKFTISVFDRLRYGDATLGTHADHLLELPDFLCTSHKGPFREMLLGRRSPWTIGQQALFDAVMCYSEATWRQFETQESGMLFMAENPDAAGSFSFEVQRINRKLNSMSMKKSKKHKPKSGLRSSSGSLADLLEEMEDHMRSDDDDGTLVSEEDRVDNLIYARPDDMSASLSLDDESVL